MFVKFFCVAACRLWMWSSNKAKISANKTIHTTTMRDCNRRTTKNPSMMSSVQLLLLLCGLAAQNVSWPYLRQNLFSSSWDISRRIHHLFSTLSWDGYFSNISHFSSYSYLFKHHMPVCIVIIFTFDISRLFYVISWLFWVYFCYVSLFIQFICFLRCFMDISLKYMLVIRKIWNIMINVENLKP